MSTNVTKVTETRGEKNCVARNGREYIVPTTTIIALAADGSEVMRRTIDGNHPMTLANTRERMASKVQDAGFAWLGRSEASETAKADALCDRMHDPAVTPRAEDRKALRDAYYDKIPHPSDY